MGYHLSLIEGARQASLLLSLCKACWKESRGCCAKLPPTQGLAADMIGSGEYSGMIEQKQRREVRIQDLVEAQTGNASQQRRAACFKEGCVDAEALQA